MSLRGAFVQRSLRWGALGLATVIAATAVSTNADARSRRHHRHHRAAATDSYQPSFASIVVDANTGAIMQSTNPDSPRHPASLTKLMTLYLLFDRLAAGKIQMSTELPVSAHAAAQAPSKLGLKPGETISVDSAIRAICTKSANDVAVIVAEAIGGDELSFAKMMTAKARSLGMMHTFYHNASGLPDDLQITTARDISMLARALQDRFPQYYHYFSTRTFAYRGQIIRNHNHLLGRVPGLDGMKTGYVRASGFNIATSVHRGDRSLIAVVFGGRTASVRDARVVGLINDNIMLASVKRTAPMVAENSENTAAPRVEEAPKPREPKATRVAAVEPASVETPPTVGSTDPIKPNTVKTFTVRAAPNHTASLSQPQPDSRKLVPAPASAAAPNVTNVATVQGEAPPASPPGARPGILGVLPANKVASATGSVPATSTVSESAKARGGWMIQVGAFDDEKDAKERLSICQTKAKDQLSKADPFTERVGKGEKALFRARFAGLEKHQAESACKNLKRGDIPCMLLKN